MTTDTLLIPTRYALPWTRIKNGPKWMRAEVVARAFNDDGTVASWAIHDLGCVLNMDGEWEIEPQPSSRDAEFLLRTRFLFAETAAEFAAKHFGRLPTTPTSEQSA